MGGDQNGINNHHRLSKLLSNDETAKVEYSNEDANKLHQNTRGNENKSRSSSESKSITVFRIIRSIFYVIIMLTSSVFMLTTSAPIILSIRPFNRNLQRRIANFLFGLWLHIPTFIFEKLNGSKVVFTGDSIPNHNKRVILICNHRTEVDWIYIWNFAIRKKNIGSVKYALKSSVRNFPFFGWIFHALEFLYLERIWAVDQKKMQKYFLNFQNEKDPLWLVIFPEGTDFSEKKKLKSQEFSKERNLPLLEHVLLPRVKGFATATDYLGNSIDCIYDLTMAYDCVHPNLLDNLLGTKPSEVHIHVRKVQISDFPRSEKATSDWLYKTFEEKDKLLDGFFKTGHFPGVSSGEELSFFKCALITVVFNLWACLQLYVGYFYFPSILYYMSASALFLAVITFFQWLPESLVSSEPKCKPRFFG